MWWGQHAEWLSTNLLNGSVQPRSSGACVTVCPVQVPFSLHVGVEGVRHMSHPAALDRVTMCAYPRTGRSQSELLCQVFLFEEEFVSCLRNNLRSSCFDAAYPVFDLVLLGCTSATVLQLQGHTCSALITASFSQVTPL